MKGYSGKACNESCSTYRYRSTCATTCPANTFPDDNTLNCIECPYVLWKFIFIFDRNAKLAVQLVYVLNVVLATIWLEAFARWLVKLST